MFKAVTTAFVMLAASGAYAQAELTIHDLASGADTKAQYTKMVQGHTLPAWVSKGATSSPQKTVKIGETEYQVLTSCKPHACGTERMAVLWSEKTKTMSGVYSVVNEKEEKESLTWLNVNDELSIDGKTVLFSALTGSLENHPDAFNYP